MTRPHELLLGHHASALDGTGEVDQRVDQFVARSDYYPESRPHRPRLREGEESAAAAAFGYWDGNAQES